MKTTFVKLRNLIFLLGLTGLISCEPDPGPAGPTGPAGATGTAGENGNANVTVISLLKSSFTWTAGLYLGRTANTYTLTNSAVNDDIIDHGTVLGYCKLSSTWYPLPFTWESNGGSSRQYIIHTYSLNTIRLYAFQTSGVMDPSTITEYRFLLITDNTVGKGPSAETDILSKLTKAGVDINNFYDVMNYFGLDY